MLFFNADPRDAYRSGGAACGACCCQDILLAPGEVNKVMINYAAWAAPLGGHHGLQPGTKFQIEKKAGAENDAAPNSDNVRAATTVGVDAAVDLGTAASDPNSLPLKFAILGLTGPDYGIIENFDEDAGTFTYVPNSSFVGYDSLFYTISNGDYTITRELQIKVSKSAPAPALADKPFTPEIRIDPKTVNVDNGGYVMSFQLAASPATYVGEVFRLTVVQPALDCDCNEYQHVSCYDIRIAKC